MTEPIVKLLDYQRRAVDSPARFNWACWSRQIGKSFTFGLRRLLRCLQTGRLQVLLSAGERQSRELMDKVRMHCQALQVANELREDRFFEGTSFRLQELTGLPRGGRVIALPANPMTARGYTGDVFLDEFAMHQHDRDIWGALFPTVMRGGGQLDIASTPKGRGNTFFRLGENAAFERSIVTIHEAVRDGLEVDVNELRAAVDDEEIWRQEFECEFIDESTAFLTYEEIAGCEDPGLALPVLIDGRQDLRSQISDLKGWIAEVPDLGECYVGVDVGRKRDFTVIWLCQREGGTSAGEGMGAGAGAGVGFRSASSGTMVTRLVIEMAGVRFRDQYEVLGMILGHPNVRGCSIDATGLGMQMAEAAVEDFGAWRVDAVNFAGASEGRPVKEKLAGQLRVKVEDRAIRIPASAAVRNDWHSIEKSVTTGGRIRYHADRNRYGHADRFWAAALCVDAAWATEQAWDGRIVRLDVRGRNPLTAIRPPREARAELAKV